MSTAQGQEASEIERESVVVALLSTWRIVAAIAGLASLVGVGVGAAGYRIVGPPQDIQAITRSVRGLDSALTKRMDSTNAAVRSLTDSLFREISRMRDDAVLSSYIQCVQVRRHDPDLRPPGCDGIEARQAGKPRR